jgi:hypothetical protein
MDDSAPWAVVGMAHGTKISLPISVLIFTAIKPFLDVCFFSGDSIYQKPYL